MMRSDTFRRAAFLQTGVLHRFFCLISLGGLFLPFSLQAQIPLDGVPVPSKEESRGASKTKEVSEQEVEAVIDRLGVMKARHASEKTGEKNIPEETAGLLMERKKAFETLPEKTGVLIELEKGNPLTGFTEGRSFRVENPAGTFPVLLHHLVEIHSLDAEKGIFKLTFKNGDLLKGKMSLTGLEVRRPDGTTVTVRTEEIKNMKIQFPSR